MTSWNLKLNLQWRHGRLQTLTLTFSLPVVQNLGFDDSSEKVDDQDQPFLVTTALLLSSG